MINYIWGFFIILGIFYSFIKGINISNEILLSSSSSIDLILSLLPVMCLWMGIVNVAKDSGLLDKLSKILKYPLKYIFKDIKNDKCYGYIASTIIMNLFGMGNASTSMGLKTMKALSEENENKEVASNNMITFLVILSSGITLIPTTVIGLRIDAGSTNPTSIVVPTIIVSFISLFIGLAVNKILQKIFK